MSYAFLDRLGRQWGTHTLGMRLVLGYALLFVVSTVALAALAYMLFLYFMREPDRAFMQEQAYELAKAYEDGGIQALRQELVSVPHDERREELLVRVVDAEGRPVLIYNPDAWKSSEIALLAAGPAPRDEAWLRLGQAVDGDELEAFTVRLSDGGVIQAGLDADLRSDALASIREAFLFVALPLLLFAMLGGAFLAFRALQPVRRLVRTLEDVIETGDVETRVPPDGMRGEFAEVAHLFNRMLDRIEALVTGLRGTLDSVAHDLRTPITGVRGRAELALEAGEASALRDALSDNLESMETITTMLDTIMEVAEAEAGTMPLQLEEIDVAELSRDVIELYAFVAEEKGIRIQDLTMPGLRIRADRRRTRQVLANLVDNAVKYTPPGGHVIIETEERMQDVSIRVMDSGPGIPSSDLPRIWDRLFRGDRSRSQRGLGLGLSLVKAIVEAHGGAVEASNILGKGTAFTIRFPRPLRLHQPTLFGNLTEL